MSDITIIERHLTRETALRAMYWYAVMFPLGRFDVQQVRGIGRQDWAVVQSAAITRAGKYPNTICDTDLLPR